ncbi:unnamed protein product [Linum trigynum]|uniref:Uncharacterized protein n=1 Tax=Linum trigynum TaxID=586398 RepID=A0AAV2EUR3_9ROSI
MQPKSEAGTSGQRSSRPRQQRQPNLQAPLNLGEILAHPGQTLWSRRRRRRFRHGSRRLRRQQRWSKRILSTAAQLTVDDDWDGCKSDGLKRFQPAVAAPTPIPKKDDRRRIAAAWRGKTWLPVFLASLASLVPFWEGLIG